MIQTSAFRHAKSMARFPIGPAGETSFQYWSDTPRQWEESNDSSKILELIGSQNAEIAKRADLRQAVGAQSPDEIELGRRFADFYAGLRPLVTSLPEEIDCEGDWLETALDLRRLEPYLPTTRRILDIGPGAGRHAVALAMSGALKERNYTGVECMGLHYALQCLIGGRLVGDKLTDGFHDLLDYQFANRPYPLEQASAPGHIGHIPLWEMDRIPDGSVDLILCCYLLDEVAPADFIRQVASINRVLAPGGVVYCRGSQERALRTNLNIYGYGHHHGLDITRALTDIGLIATECDLVADAITRVFVRPAAGQTVTPAAPFGQYVSDVDLIPALLDVYVNSVVEELAASQARVLVWGKPGYRRFNEVFGPFRDRLNIIGFTRRNAPATTQLADGSFEYPPAAAAALNPDAVLFPTFRLRSYYRELRELSPPGSYSRLRYFLTPLAVAFR